MAGISRSYSHSVPPVFGKALPSQIRFTRLTCSPRLSSGLHVVDLFRRCLCGNISIEELTVKNRSTFTVIECDDNLWVTDGNKRLWILQKLEEMGLCSEISFQIIHSYRRNLKRLMSTHYDGKTIEFGETPAEHRGFEEQFNTMLQECEGVDPVTSSATATRFLWADHPSPGQILSRWVDKKFHSDELYQWYFGAHSVETRLAMGIAFVLLVISLVGMGKESPWQGCSAEYNEQE